MNLSNIIRVTEDEEEATEEDYAEFMPDFVWVLRDFSLNLVDGEGQPITPNEYLETALEERYASPERATTRSFSRRTASARSSAAASASARATRWCGR